MQTGFNRSKWHSFFFGTLPPAPGGYEGVHHTPSVIWFRAYSSTNLCMAFVSTEIRTPALVVRSQSSIDGATPQLALKPIGFDFDFELFVDKKLVSVLVSNYAIYAFWF